MKRRDWFGVVGIFALFLLLFFAISHQIRENMLQSDPKLEELKRKVAPLFTGDNNFTGHLAVLNGRNLLKEISVYKGKKSYTINKQKVFMCLYDENNELYPDPILIYPFLHELTHVLLTNEIGHTETFHIAFEELLREAEEMGIYDPSIPMDPNYCEYASEDDS